MPETIYDALKAVASARPDHLAYAISDRHFDERVSFGELDAQVAAVATSLAELGFGRGDRLAVWLPNLPEWLVLQVAASRLGMIVLSINTKYRVEEISHLLSLGRPRCVAFAPGFLNIDFGAMLEQALGEIDGYRPDLNITVRGADQSAGARRTATFEELASRSPDLSRRDPPRADELAVLFPTSGTTSLPKLAAHDQRSIVRHSINAARALEMTADDVLLCPLPLCGVFGYNAAFTALLTGASCLSQAAFSGPDAAELGDANRATHLICTDPMLNELVAAKRPATLRRGIVSITGDHPQRLIEEAERTLGVALTDVYGSSECFALLAFWPASASSELRAIKGGALLPGVEVRILDVESRSELGPGERGEILFRGYNVLRCYLDNPEANERALDADGWYRTGDLGYLDADSRLVFLSRLDDSLRLRGFLVNPGEVEMLLERHPAVGAAQVVGVKDEGGNDLPVAFVIPAGKSLASAEDLQAFCRKRAASYKVPDRIWFVERFPVTVGTNGAKVQRNVLREQARTLLASSRSS